MQEPSSLRQEQEGGQGSPGFFIRPSHILFVRTEGLFAEPILVRAKAAGLGKVAGRAPSLYVRGPSGVPLAFYTPLAREGLFAEAPLGASPGHGVSAYLQEEPPSLYTGREGRQELPCLFVRPSRFLFARKEGLFC